jgi:hypothetical protein
MENNRLHCEKNDLSLQTVHRLGDKIIHKTKKKAKTTDTQTQQKNGSTLHIIAFLYVRTLIY